MANQNLENIHKLSKNLYTRVDGVDDHESLVGFPRFKRMVQYADQHLKSYDDHYEAL